MSILIKQWRSDTKKPGGRVQNRNFKQAKKLDKKYFLKTEQLSFINNKRNLKARMNNSSIIFEIRNYVYWGLGALAICVFVLVFQKFVPTLKKAVLIETVAITGELANTNGDQIEMAIEDLVESDYFSIKLGAIKAVLEKFPWIKSVDIRRIWPNSILININEKQAIAYWQNKELLSAEAEIFNPKEIKSLGQLPKLSGPEDKAVFVMHNYHQMNRILSAVGLNIESLHLEDRYSWQLKLNTKMTVRVDDKKSLEKIKNMVSLLKKVSVEEIVKIKSIDLRYENGMALSHSQKKLAG